MNALKQRLLTNWHLMRIVRMAIGLMLLVSGIQQHDWMIGVFSTFFLYQAITDTGCCGSRGCNTTTLNRSEITNDKTTVEYEEIK